MIRINLHPEKVRIALAALAAAAAREKSATQHRNSPYYRRHLDELKALNGVKVLVRGTESPPEWNEIDAPVPMGWWRDIADAPGLIALEPGTLSNNPDDWTEEEEYEMKIGVATGAQFAYRDAPPVSMVGVKSPARTWVQGQKLLALRRARLARLRAWRRRSA